MGTLYFFLFSRKDKYRIPKENQKIFYLCRNLALLSSIFAANLEKGRKKREKTVVIKPILNQIINLLNYYHYE